MYLLEYTHGDWSRKTWGFGVGDFGLPALAPPRPPLHLHIPNRGEGGARETGGLGRGGQAGQRQSETPSQETPNLYGSEFKKYGTYIKRKQK